MHEWGLIDFDKLGMKEIQSKEDHPKLFNEFDVGRSQHDGTNEDIIFDFTNDRHHVARRPKTTLLNNIKAVFRHLESTG